MVVGNKALRAKNRDLGLQARSKGGAESALHALQPGAPKGGDAVKIEVKMQGGEGK